MDKTKAETLQKAVADAVGGDVKAEEIAIKGVQFPVESKIELSTSKSAVDADRAGFETKFKMASPSTSASSRRTSSSRTSRRRRVAAAAASSHPASRSITKWTGLPTASAPRQSPRRSHPPEVSRR
jgi:hypothetical protein